MLALMHTQMAVGFPHSNSQPIPREVTQVISPPEWATKLPLQKKGMERAGIRCSLRALWELFVGEIEVEIKFYFSCVYIHIHKKNALV